MTEKYSVNLFYVRIALIRHALLLYVKIFLKKTGVYFFVRSIWRDIYT